MSNITEFEDYAKNEIYFVNYHNFKENKQKILKKSPWFLKLECSKRKLSCID